MSRLREVSDEIIDYQSPSVQSYHDGLSMLAQDTNMDLLIVEDDMILREPVPVQDWKRVSGIVVALYKIRRTSMYCARVEEYVSYFVVDGRFQWFDRNIDERDLAKGERYIRVTLTGFGCTLIRRECVSLLKYANQVNTPLKADTQFVQACHKHCVPMHVDSRYRAGHYDR